MKIEIKLVLIFALTLLTMNACSPKQNNKDNVQEIKFTRYKLVNLFGQPT